MKIKSRGKHILVFLLCMSIMLTFTGCSGKEEKQYQAYVKSLIAINYLGAKQDYIEATGANQADADALYDSNIRLLTDNLLNYYQVKIDAAPELRSGFEDLARNIYSKSNYKVDKARKDGSVYLVDVTIYPIMLFSQTSGDVTAYVNTFNEKVTNGEYNDYTLDQYETEFAQGLLDILNQGCINMQYGEPVIVTVEIVVDGDKFYISNRDFLKIDNAMISAAVVVPSATPSDAE